MIEGKGDFISTSLLPDDGTYLPELQVGKRNIALEVPVWDLIYVSSAISV
jgi:hypothetical protein